MTDTAITRPITTCGTATLGDLIRRQRRAKGLDQAELGERVGVDFWTIKQIERGNDVPNLATRFALAKALDIDLKVLTAAPTSETPAAALPRPNGAISAVDPRPVTDFTMPLPRTDRLIDERPAPAPVSNRIQVRSHLVIAPVGILDRKVSQALDRIQSHQISITPVRYATVHGITYHPASGGLVAAITYASNLDLFVSTPGVS